jgi:hypothetical protein
MPSGFAIVLAVNWFNAKGQQFLIDILGSMRPIEKSGFPFQKAALNLLLSKSNHHHYYRKRQ